jgi:hypothetical protein
LRGPGPATAARGQREVSRMFENWADYPFQVAFLMSVKLFVIFECDVDEGEETFVPSYKRGIDDGHENRYQ